MAERRDTDDQPAAQPVTMPQRQVIRERMVVETNDPPLGPNMSTDPEDPAEHYFLASDGETKVNAFGEVKGSKEDKQRMAALGF